MSAPERLLDEKAPSVAKELLRAAAEEQPGAHVMQKTLGAMSGAGAAAAGAVAAKWIGLGTIVLALGSAIAWKVLSAPPAPPPPTPVAVARPTASTSEPPREELPAITPAASSAPPASAPPAIRRVESLADQIKALDAARKQLAAGDAKGCLTSVDRLMRDHPTTPLEQEATELRIEALAASGRTAEARTLMTRFLAKHPDSPYATRLHTVVGP